MKWSLALLGAQVPLHSPYTSMSNQPFAFRTGHDRFSPEDLVQLGRPSQAIANLAGDLVVVSYSKHDISSKKTTSSAFVIPVADDPHVRPLQLTLGSGDEVFWLDGTTLAKAVRRENQYTDICIVELSWGGNILSILAEPLCIGTIPTSSASNFRFVPKAGKLVFTDYVHSDGDLTKVNSADKAWELRGNTAFVYDATFERHWDTFVGPKTSSVFSVNLAKDPDRIWHFGDTFNNLLQHAEKGHATPIEPFGGADHFDVSDTSVVYTTKDPKKPLAVHTKTDVYLVDIDGRRAPQELTEGDHGASTNPVFNHDGSKVAWLQMDEDGYEADRNQVVIYDLRKKVRFTLTHKWDRSPNGLVWSKNGDFVYFTAEEDAQVYSYVLPVPTTPRESSRTPDLPSKYQTPVQLTTTGYASGIQTLAWNRLLITKSALTNPNEFYILTKLDELEKQIDSSDSLVQYTGYNYKLYSPTAHDSNLKGKYMSSGEKFYFKGFGNDTVQGWALRPHGWKENQTKKYPAVLLIHGGPQGSWEDNWSTRWNPNVFAGQGYFVVMINPRGSTGFGQKFTDEIAQDWGGKVWTDLRNGWKYALGNYPEIDTDRTVAAGASWGGYAINWIQGHPEYEEFKFKALVCHDGVFHSIYNGYATDELYFWNHDFGGAPYTEHAKELGTKFSPATYVDKWHIPQLTIHGSKDYRIPETDGIGAFHALQQLGVPSRLVIFPDENHWVLKHGNSLKWHFEVFRWFDIWVGKKDEDDA